MEKMQYMRDPRKLQPIVHQKQQIMEGRCRKHPEHRQSKGVCPFCLRDRLSQLSASSSATTTLANSSATSASSNLSSAATSPRGHAPHNTSRLLKPGGALKKSRSLAFVIGRPKDKKKAEEEEKKRRKKKGGFWSKLVMGSERRKEAEEEEEEEDSDVLRSRTMKEKTSAKWTLF
ncbi:hypothetical protein Cni_G06351 [Canna indica]|uniref:Uncharacterized protein n=1 Tax=Canna indica TaxID=4628 RepID=A0AAQ3Q4P1_9LILI|nr:hypothetical protein Cni_G06351 [Canna indica]